MAEEVVMLITVSLYFLSEMREKDCVLSMVLKSPPPKLSGRSIWRGRFKVFRVSPC